MSKKNNNKHYNNKKQIKSCNNKSNKSYISNSKRHNVHKKSKGHNPSGKKISADLAQFQGTRLELVANMCKKYLPDRNDFTALKQEAKQAYAQRIRFSSKKLNIYQKISNNSKLIIRKYLQDNGLLDLFGNVSCIINAYNSENQNNLKEPKYGGTQKDKVFQHLEKDIDKVKEKYIYPAKKHAEKSMSQCPELIDIVREYQILIDSLDFFYEYMLKIITAYIPDKIQQNSVKDAHNLFNLDLNKYYIFDSANGVYTSRSKLPYSVIEEAYATYLIYFCK